MKRLWIWCFALIVSGVMVGCNRGTDTGADSNATPRIAFVMKSLNNPFFIQMEEGAKEEAAKQGVELIVQAAQREVDVERQMQIVENLIQTQVDAICLTPSGSTEILPAIQKANEAGIPVLIVDSGIDEEAANAMEVETTTFIGSDNYQGGKLAGEFMIKRFSEPAEVGVLEGIPGHETGDARLRGFMDAVNQANHIKVVASQPADSERAKGFDVFQNMLQTYPNIKGLFAANDMMALGAMEAIDQAGKTGEIVVIGFDAVDEARKAIDEGRMAASVAQNPAEMGRVGVATALEVINGESVPDVIPVAIELVVKE